MAWLGLCRARYRLVNSGHLPTDEGYRLAREAVERALTLAPNLAEAHALMGEFKQNVDFDWAGGDASIQHAVALEPESARIVASAALSAAQLGSPRRGASTCSPGARIGSTQREELDEGRTSPILGGILG